MADAHAEGALQLRLRVRAVAASTFELSHRRGLAQRSTTVVRAAAARAASCASVAQRRRSKTGRRARGGPVRLLARVGRVRLSPRAGVTPRSETRRPRVTRQLRPCTCTNGRNMALLRRRLDRHEAHHAVVPCAARR